MQAKTTVRKVLYQITSLVGSYLWNFRVLLLNKFNATVQELSGELIKSQGLPLYRNQSINCIKNQVTGFYIIVNLVLDLLKLVRIYQLAIFILGFFGMNNRKNMY